MQIGVTHLIAPEMPLADFFMRAAQAGYEVVEIAMREEGELTPDTPADALRNIVNQAQTAGVKISSMCHTHITGNLLASGDSQSLGIDQTIAGLRAANIMGIDTCLHLLGKPDPNIFYDDAYRNVVSALKKLAPHCEKLNVSIAYEFTWRGFFFSPLEIRRLLDEVNSRFVGFYFDPGNMAVFQYPHHWARILGKHIKRVHLKDWKGHALEGAWPALLKGNIDYAAINKELRAVRYDGPMVSEVSLDEATLEETAAAIRKIIQM